MVISLQRKIVRLLCCRSKQQSKHLTGGVEHDRFSQSIDSFLFAKVKEVAARHPKYDSTGQREEFEETSLELFPARQFYHALVLYLGTHGQGDEVLSQVAEHCSAEVGFNVVDEINQRVLLLYPAAVDVQLDDDATVIDGLASVHNSPAAWKSRISNYRAEHDHFADVAISVPHLTAASPQMNVCRKLSDSLEDTVAKLREAYAAVPAAELVFLYESALPEGRAEPEDATAMAAELAALELTQLLGIFPAEGPAVAEEAPRDEGRLMSHHLSVDEEFAAAPTPGRTPGASLSMRSAGQALRMGQRLRNQSNTAHLGLLAGTPKRERQAPWAGHQNLGKRKTGLGEFGAYLGLLPSWFLFHTLRRSGVEELSS